MKGKPTSVMYSLLNLAVSFWHELITCRWQLHQSLLYTDYISDFRKVWERSFKIIKRFTKQQENLCWDWIAQNQTVLNGMETKVNKIVLNLPKLGYDCSHIECVCVCMHVWARVHIHTHLCLTLCNPMNCSPLDSSVYGIFQARIREWIAISYSRGSSQSRFQTSISCIPCTGRQILYTAPPGKPSHID